MKEYYRTAQEIQARQNGLIDDQPQAAPQPQTEPAPEPQTVPDSTQVPALNLPQE